METVITILDAKVEEKNWEVLKDTYRKEVPHLPDSIHQTFLIQSKSEPNSWRILTQWRSLEDLEKMRQSTSIPVGVRIFQEASAKPVLGVWNVVLQRVNTKSPLFKAP